MGPRKKISLYTLVCFPGGSDGKESACNAGDLALIPGSKRSPGEEMAAHSSILTWEIPWAEQSTVHGTIESDMTATNTFTRSFRSVILFCRKCQFSSVTQSCPTLRPRGPQHARPPCPSPTPGVYSNSCPSSQWCHPTTSASVVPFSSWLQCQAFTNSSRSYSPEIYSFGESYFRDLKLCHEAPAYWHWDPSRSFWVVLKISSQPCSCVGWRKKGG